MIKKAIKKYLTKIINEVLIEKLTDKYDVLGKVGHDKLQMKAKRLQRAVI